MKKLNRRHFLAGLGVGAATLGLPFTRTLTGAAKGADGFPKRFVAFFTANGTLPNRWASGSGTSFELGSILTPLAPFREKLLLVRGLDMDCTREGPGAGHQKGIGGLLTGQPLNDGEFTGGDGSIVSGWAAGPSIDQRIAQDIGGDTRFGSLELGVTVRGSNNRHRLAYRGSDDPIPPDNDPWNVYERLFADLGEDPGGLQRVRDERRSVIDLVRGDLLELEGKLGASERHRLDAHLESLRDVERRMDAIGAAGAACENPMMPGRIDPMNRDNHAEISVLQLDLLAMAFACDLTRVATVLYAGATSGQTFNWLGFGESHHSLSHEADSNTSAQNKLEQINHFYAEQLAYFLAKLDAIPEGDGTVLDNTIVLWCNALAKGNTHSRRDMSFVVAGSGGGYLDTGRLVEFDGRQHNDLLVTLANAYGVDIDRWGHPGYTEGPLGRLVA
jgi:hypothetical protein